MIQVKATLKFLRMSPRKVRLVAALVRGMETGKAVNQLTFANKAAALPVLKLIKSAVANAVENFGLKADNLKIETLMVDGGPVLKRWAPKAHGRATPLRKRTSHITVILTEIKDTGVHESKKVKADAPIKLGAKPEQTEGVKVSDKDEVLDADTKAVDGSKDKKGKLAQVGHAKIEGGPKGHTKREFRRKSG